MCELCRASQYACDQAHAVTGEGCCAGCEARHARHAKGATHAATNHDPAAHPAAIGREIQRAIAQRDALDMHT